MAESDGLEIPCLFVDVLPTCNPWFGSITPISMERMQNVIKSSKDREDLLDTILQNHPNKVYSSHINCLSTYHGRFRAALWYNFWFLVEYYRI